MAYLIRKTLRWFGGRGRQKHRTPLELDNHTLRDIGVTKAEYQFLPMSGPSTRWAKGGGEHIMS